MSAPQTHIPSTRGDARRSPPARARAGAGRADAATRDGGRATDFGRLPALALAVGAALVALAWPAAARAERVGVVVVATVNTHGSEADELSDSLGHALRARLDVDVIAGAEVTRRLPPEGMPETCVADAACQRDLARRLEADQLLLLAVVRVGTRVQIDITWVDPASGRTASRDRVRLEDGAAVAEVFEAAAAALLPDAAPRPEAAPAAVVAAPARAPEPPLPPPRRHLTTGVWIAAGVGVAALATGAVVGGDAWRRYRDLDEDGCGQRPCALADIEAVDDRALAADALVLVGVVAGATAAILYWRSGSAREPTAARARPDPVHLSISPRAGGLQVGLGGRF
ncbi:hypothetical protein [Haliangium sp.]|uniref:hypothetical protein n=1 Tax=Haliangium sp. TaxID=2663208 RepID=UPI003D11C2CE